MRECRFQVGGVPGFSCTGAHVRRRGSRADVLGEVISEEGPGGLYSMRREPAATPSVALLLFQHVIISEHSRQGQLLSWLVGCRNVSAGEGLTGCARRR